MTTHNDPDLIVRAYLLHKDNPTRSARSIALELGISDNTVRRYCDLGQHAEVWLPVYSKAEMTTIVHEALAELLQDSLTDARSADDGKERALHRQVVLGAVDRVMKLHGLAAPTQHVVTSGDPAPPSPELAQALRKALVARRSDQERNTDPARDDEPRYPTNEPE